MSPDGKRVCAKMARLLRLALEASAELSEADWEKLTAHLAHRDCPVIWRDLKCLRFLLLETGAAKPQEAGE